MQNVTTICRRRRGTSATCCSTTTSRPRETQLIAAFNQLKAAGVTDLVLDIRYNGGGYLDIASEVAYMIAGPRPRPARRSSAAFNDKYPTTIR